MVKTYGPRPGRATRRLATALPIPIGRVAAISLSLNHIITMVPSVKAAPARSGPITRVSQTGRRCQTSRQGCFEGDHVACPSHAGSEFKIATGRAGPEPHCSLNLKAQPSGLEPPKLTVAGPRSWLEPGQKEAGESLGPLRWRDEQVIVCQLAKKTQNSGTNPLHSPPLTAVKLDFTLQPALT